MIPPEQKYDFLHSGGLSVSDEPVEGTTGTGGMRGMLLPEIVMNRAQACSSFATSAANEKPGPGLLAIKAARYPEAHQRTPSGCG